jgi:glycosyltransferase involved in cell wall biosynthesis
MFRVTHYSGDRMGGAARAMLRLHAAFREDPIVESRAIVAEKIIDDYTVNGLDMGIRGRLGAIIKSAADAAPRRLAKPQDNMPRSAGWATRLTAADVNSSFSDIAHLHWINGGLLSVEEIGKITKPLVWTFHDMWPFCGAEHLAPDTPEARWRTGYLPLSDTVGFDIDRWVWKRKKACWRKLIHVVAPSRWLADCVRQSSLMDEFPVHVIPNALNVDVYKPMDKLEARRLLNLPPSRKLVLFGAIRGTQLTYKGWDLLMPALVDVSRVFPGADAVIFGQSQPAEQPNLPYHIHWMGHLHDDFTLAALYSAADVLVIPSRQEAFGQTGSEAQACGCPVVAFDSTGLKDVVAHENTGFLVKAYDPSALGSAIVTVLENDDLHFQFSQAARERAKRLWSFSAVAEQYREVYDSALRL